MSVRHIVERHPFAVPANRRPAVPPRIAAAVLILWVAVIAALAWSH